MSNQRILIAYDISDDKTRRRFVMLLANYGTRLQHSVFMSKLSSRELLKLQGEIDTFIFKAKSAKLHLGNRTLKVMVIPICRACERGMRLSDNEFPSDKFIVA